MATKRAAPDVHPSRREQVPGEPQRKKHKPEHGTKSFKKAHPVNELKTQIRSLQRLLRNKDDLPANIQIEKERALQTARHELQQSQDAEKRNKMIARYHKIRFFDRQKATKRLKRAKKELRACEDEAERAALGKAVDDAEVDLNYALYFPLDEPYISLFPSQKRSEHLQDEQENGQEEDDSLAPGQPSERAGDPEMWQLVKKCMAEGTLDSLRHGRLRQKHKDPRAEGRKTDERASRAHKKDDLRQSDRMTNGRKSYGKSSISDPDDSAEDGGGFFE